MTDHRIGPPHFGSERETLRAFLDYHRATLAMKCEGLGDEELRRQSMPPSTLSLLGLVRHMAEVERTWFRRVFEDHDIPMVWSDKIDFQAAYDASPPPGPRRSRLGRPRSSTRGGSSGTPSPSTSRATSRAGARTCRCAW